jgi:hypothetical protein
MVTAYTFHVPRNVKVIRGPDFIRAQPEGRVHMEAAEQLLREIAEAGNGLEDFDVLVDLRQVTGNVLSPAELWSLSEKLARYRRSLGRRTAILCPLERFDSARFFALCADNRGFDVHAFTSYEDAMEWLLTDAARA